MKKKVVLLALVALGVTLLLGITYAYYTISKKMENSLINISGLSEEFIDNYYEELSSIESDEEKENLLIVISDTKIKNSYGAKKIIEAPNNQYILKYDSSEAKDEAFNKLKKDNSIDSVEENIVYTIEEATYDSWGIEKVGLDYAIASSNMEFLDAVTVAIIDTGIDLQLFNRYYSGKIVETYNVLEESTTSMADENGHGTHIAGTIAEGTPANVKILPIKVSRNGKMYSTDVVAAINYIVYNRKADVINMSFGSYYKSEVIAEAIDAANEMNIICVAAAGNDNTSAGSYPSALDNTISIASVDAELKKSDFSNYGSSITFAAPGTNIKSLMGKDAQIAVDNGNNDDDDHEIISGTSMATPHAVSAVAILKGYNKDLTLDNIIELLRINAIDLGDKGWDQYFGYGLISFDNVQFCDNTYCDEYGVFKDLNKNIINIQLTELKLTEYNYYSSTNLMASKFKVFYSDGTSEEMLLGKLSNLEILNYNPVSMNEQMVTIKTGDVSIEINVTNPSDYESGWKYNVLASGEIELTGYKSHNLDIDRLYVPETIDSKTVVSFADDVKFNELGTDFASYTYLYLPTGFKRIGNYSLSGTNIKYIYGDSKGVEVGSFGLESSSITTIDIPITKIENGAFKDAYELIYVNVSSGVSDIGDYAFYNCKKLVEVRNLKDFPYKYVSRVGKNAFYNCISLSSFELKLTGSVEEYAFANCFELITLDLGIVDLIGEYAFYSSGISEVNFGPNLEIVNKSAFENCKNLKVVYFTRGGIEARAFWNSGVEEIHIDSSIEYIAEDAFAYAPIKSGAGSGAEEAVYYADPGLGIVENGNKLLVGFTDALGASNTKIPDYITEIGNYAFTGNNNLKKITIPSNVTKLGTYAFEDCYQLSDVYMLGSSISFENDTFKRIYEGEIQVADLNIYVYKDSVIKQFVKNKNLNYRHIEPDEVVVTNEKTSYQALEIVDESKISVKLIYHEEENREEILSPINYTVVAPISNGVGFYITYPDNKTKFEYDDTYYVVNAKNVLGYETSKKIEIEVLKATPSYKIPTNLTANLGQKLSEIVLPSGFEWMNNDEKIEEVGEIVFKAKYVPDDTKNYEIVENIDITVNVNSSKTIVTPDIMLQSMTYNGTTTIPISLVIVSNLENTEYSVVSAISSSADVGKRTATIKLRLDDEKFKNYSFDNGGQEKEFTVDFEILKANINVNDSSEDVTVKYDGFLHSIKMKLECDLNITVKYMDENNEYTLNEIPKYTEVGTYVTKYRVYINDNYTEYFGQKVLTIEDTAAYVINNYSVDETNGYISKIIVNTDVNTFTSNIILGYGYGVDVDYKEIMGKKVIYTGSKTRITKDLDLYREFTNIVIGDINGDGAINSADLLKIRRHLLKSITISGPYFLASDINDDNTINSADLLRVRQHLLGIKPIE